MKPSRRLHLHAIVVVTALVLGLTPSPTQAASKGNAPAPVDASAQPRTAEAILADFVQALGGEAAWKKHKSLKVDMTLEVKGLALAGKAQALWTAEGHYLETGEIPKLLMMKRGGSGQRFWSQDPIDGLRWLDEAEAEQTALAAAWGGYTALTRFSRTSETIPPEGANQECVKLTYEHSPPTTYCFDTQTHRLLLEIGKKVSPQGETPYTTRFSDYRASGGVWFPYVQETAAGPATFIVTVSEIAWDVPAPKALFKLPAKGTSRTNGK